MNKLITILAISFSLVFLSGCNELEEITGSDSGDSRTTTAQSEANSVEATENKIFEGNTRLKVSSKGMAFTIPQGWRGGVSENSIALENTDVGYIVVVVDDDSEQQSRTIMSNTMDMGDGIFLQPNSQVSKQGNILFAEYEVYGTGKPTVGYVIKWFGDNGKGFAIIGVGLTNKKADLKSAVNAMSDSLRMFQAKANNNSPVASNDSNNYWAQQLGGLRLTYFNTQTGYSEKFVITLCSNGAFTRSSNTSGFDNQGFSAAVQGGGDGNWETSGNQNSGQLQLNYNDGDVGSYSIEVNDEGLFLNGERYFREDAGC